MWNIIIAVILFILSIPIHELVHYITAKHYGYDVKFHWVDAKSKGSIGIFGKLPGIRIKGTDRMTVKEHMWISLSPIPFISVLSFVMLVLATYSDKSINRLLFWLFLCAFFGLLATLFGSSNDIKEYLKFKQKKEVT